MSGESIGDEMLVVRFDNCITALEEHVKRPLEDAPEGTCEHHPDLTKPVNQLVEGVSLLMQVERLRLLRHNGNTVVRKKDERDGSASAPPRANGRAGMVKAFLAAIPLPAWVAIGVLLGLLIPVGFFVLVWFDKLKL